MLPDQPAPSEPKNENGQYQTRPEVDLQALAKEILALLKEELRIDSERHGR